jgi:hypothetical protein
MHKTRNNKLAIRKETLRRLGDAEIGRAAGGAGLEPLTFGMECRTANCDTLGEYCDPTNNCMTLGERCRTADCQLTFGRRCGRIG